MKGDVRVDVGGVVWGFTMTVLQEVQLMNVYCRLKYHDGH